VTSSRSSASSYDLVVVGAGPAGAAAALAMLRRRPGARVLLLDKAAFPRDKTCGDAISADGVAELARLGAGSAVDGYAPMANVHVRSPGGVEVAGSAPEPGYVVPRLVFDARLVALAVAAGAELRRARVREVSQDAAGVVVDGRFRAPVAVAADGANSAVRRGLGVPPNRDGHIGIALRGYAPMAGPRELSLRWVDGGGPAYGWTFPVDACTRNVGFGLLAHRIATKDQLEEGLRRTLGSVDVDPRSLKAHHLPMSSGRPVPYAGRVLLAGDAASLVNPLTGEGIFYALLSGRLAALAAAEVPGAPGPHYAALLRRALGRHLRHTAALARLTAYPSLTDLLVAIARDPRVLDTVGELAFGKGVITPRMATSLALAAWRQRGRQSSTT
jgi:geranylgeranyl reductase family protein